MSKSKQSLLWQFTNQLGITSYLFGTMHVRDNRAFHNQALVEEKILDCDVYAAEMNLNEVNQSAMSDSMDLDGDVTLSDLMKPKVYKRLEKLFVKQTGFPLFHFEQSQPILITNLVTETLMATDAPLSLDATLWRFAEENDKVIMGIETFEEQLKILEKIPLDYQVKGLSDMVRNWKKFKKQLFQLTEIYQSGDIQKLYKKTKKQSGPLRKLMIYDRNALMAERIANLANEQSLFVSVGAAHLAGGKGIIRLLKKQGFKVKAVTK